MQRGINPWFRSLALTVISVASLNAQAPKSVRYFPEHAFAKWNGDGSFTSQWFSSQLSAMHEPSLFERNSSPELRVRFLYLPSFSNPTSVRVDVQGDGTGIVTVVTGKWAGGYAPKKKSDTSVKSLSKEQIAALKVVLEQNHFWSISTEPKTPENGCDGTEWVMEASEKDRYHVVDRWEGAALSALGKYFISDVAGRPDLASQMSATVPADR